MNKTAISAVAGIVCSVMAVLAVVDNKAPDISVSKQGLAHIANAEGCRLKAYQCSANKWTVGLGHTHGVSKHTQISLERAADLLIADVKHAEQTVKKLIKHAATQGELDMMTSFVINLGAHNFKHSTLLKKFNAGDKLGACNEYLRWVYVNKKDCRIKANHCAGIARRRQIERDICVNNWATNKKEKQ